MSEHIIDNMINAIKSKQAPLFTPPAHIPHLRPTTQPTPTYVVRQCKFCGHNCHGDFALAQHLSEHLHDDHAHSYIAQTAARYDKYRLDALQILHRHLVVDYTEDQRLDAMVECDKFSGNYSFHGCNGEYVDGGRPNAWIIHVLRKHSKQEMIDQFSREDWNEFKDAYKQAMPELEKAYALVRGRK